VIQREDDGQPSDAVNNSIIKRRYLARNEFFR